MRAGVAVGTTFLRNISDPTLTVFTPTAGSSNGVGIIVVPGGGWTINAWSHEGLDVADWLAALGYTAFLLKYRVQASPADQAAFEAAMAAIDAGLAVPRPKAQKPGAIGDLISTPEYLAAREACADDGRRAVELVREHAERFGVLPGTVGMIGFSAGAFLAVDVALDPRAEQLAFIAPIYGGETRGAPVPPDAPPMFTAVAEDDILVKIVEGVHAEWSAADRPSELHVFAREVAMASAWSSRVSRLTGGPTCSSPGSTTWAGRLSGPSAAEGSGLAARSWRDVDQLSRLSQGDLVPDALGDDDGVSCAELDGSIAVGELEPDGHRAGDEEQQLVAVGMHLTVVRGIAGEHGCTDGEPIDALWSLARSLRHEPRCGRCGRGRRPRSSGRCVDRGRCRVSSPCSCFARSPSLVRGRAGSFGGMGSLRPPRAKKTSEPRSGVRRESFERGPVEDAEALGRQRLDAHVVCARRRGVPGCGDARCRRRPTRPVRR